MCCKGNGFCTRHDSIDLFKAYSISGKVLLITLELVMAVIMQAESAAIPATLTALYADPIDFEQTDYLVIGQNVGKTAIFAAIGASTATLVMLGATLVFSLTKKVTSTIKGNLLRNGCKTT